MTGETEVGGRPTLLVGRPPAFNRHLVDPHNPTSPIEPVAPPNSRPAPKLNSTQAPRQSWLLGNFESTYYAKYGSGRKEEWRWEGDGEANLGDRSVEAAPPSFAGG